MPNQKTIDEISRLEELSRALQPDSLKRNEWLREISIYADAFLNKLENLKAFNQEDLNGREFSKNRVSDNPTSMHDALAFYDQQVMGHGLNPASGYHFGYIPGGGIVHSAYGDYIADVTNLYAGVYFAGPGAVRLENMLIRWLCDLAGYPENTSGGYLSSGGSIATLTAIVAARDHADISIGDLSKSVIYLTRQAHHSILKSLHISGLDDLIMRQIPMDQSFRMRPGELEKQILADINNDLKPFMIIATAGTTDIGAIDPLNHIGDIAAQHSCWFHVDAAYGGFFLLCDEIKHKMQGIEKADSIVIDPHKGLFLPYGSGALIVRNIQTLLHSFRQEANYLQDTTRKTHEISPSDLSPELSRPFRGLRMWLPLAILGVSPFKAALEEKILLARYFQEKVTGEIPGMEVGPNPELSIALFRYIPSQGDPDHFNRLLLDAIHKDGRVFFSSTSLNNHMYIRLAVVNFRTHLKHVDTAISLLKEKIHELEK